MDLSGPSASLLMASSTALVVKMELSSCGRLVVSRTAYGGEVKIQV